MPRSRWVPSAMQTFASRAGRVEEASRSRLRSRWVPSACNINRVLGCAAHLLVLLCRRVCSMRAAAHAAMS